MGNLRRDYFEWMLGKVGVTRRTRPSYYRLLEDLDQIEFEFYIDIQFN